MRVEASPSEIQKAKRFLINKRVMLLGGPELWVRNIKKHYPNWIYVEITKFKKGSNTIKNKKFDCIAIYSRCVSHNTQNIARTICKNSGNRLCIITSSNADLIAYEIYTSLYKNELESNELESNKLKSSDNVAVCAANSNVGVSGKANENKHKKKNNGKSKWL